MNHTNLGTKTTLQGFHGIGARAVVVCIAVVDGVFDDVVDGVVDGAVVGNGVVGGEVVDGDISVVFGNFPKTRMLKFVRVDKTVVVVVAVDIGDTVDDTGIVPDSGRPGRPGIPGRVAILSRARRF